MTCPRCRSRLYRDIDIEYGWCLYCGSVRLAPYDGSWMDEKMHAVRSGAVLDRRREERLPRGIP